MTTAAAEHLAEQSKWMIMTSDREFLDHAARRITADEKFIMDDRAILWTDNYSSLAGLFY